jgi:S-adenosylmethionine:tRNA ribosyltransferase-isomerase
MSVNIMKLSEFYYDFPGELIAQDPLKKRDTARLMVLDRAKRTIKEKVFRDIADYMQKGDCLILNDTRVIPARLYGRRKTGGKVEIFLLDSNSQAPRALIRPSKRVKEGEEIELESGIRAVVLGPADAGRFVQFEAPLKEVLKDGHVPLPPYISREEHPEDGDDYQTVFARKDGATASPTAGLHFTQELLKELDEKGVKAAYVTLHTSYGTFAPVKEEVVEEHVMHPEYFEINEKTTGIVNETRSSGGRVFAVGTTSTRVLETAAVSQGIVTPTGGETSLFIYPGYEFKIINGIITNFHLPESTLLMLACAFAGKDFIFEAYKRAIELRFRFFSYGDAMLIL